MVVAAVELFFATAAAAVFFTVGFAFFFTATLRAFFFRAAAAPGFGPGESASLGPIVRWLINAAGFTPAAIASLVALCESGDCFTVPCKSGFTTICRS